MPKTMPSAVTALKNQISQPGAWVWLLVLAAPDGTVLKRWATNPDDVTYDGQTYEAAAALVGSFELNLDSQIPETTISMANIADEIQELLYEYDGLVEGTLSFVCVNTQYLAYDWSEDLTTMTIDGCEVQWDSVPFNLSVPTAMRRRVPEDRYNAHACRHAFRNPSTGEYTARCGYEGSAIDSISLPSGSPVSIQLTDHPFLTGDEVRIFDLVGITGDLDGDYDVTKVDADHFTLDGTDGDDYAGSFTSGSAGFAQCRRIPTDCIARGRYPIYFGGPVTLQHSAVRYA